VPHRLLGMALRRWAVVVFVLASAACSPGGGSTATTSGKIAATAPTTTGIASASTTSTIQPSATTVKVPPTLSDSGQSGFDNALGTSERACVDVDQIVATEEPEMVGPDEDVPVFDIRSGEMLAGNFASVVNKWSEWPDGTVKIYWVPFDFRVATTGPLEVTVEPLDGSGPTVVQTFEQLASNAAGIFWPSGTKFPQPGRYRLTVTAPGHWGCFELTV